VKNAAVDAVEGPGAAPDVSLRARAVARAAGVAVPFLGVLLAVAVPIIAHPLPPLSDYINHLATDYVIDAIPADHDLDRFYLIEWKPIPDLMMDLVVPLLHRFVGIYAAGQIFTISIFAIILSGTLALHRALSGRWSALPLLASPFLYSGVLLVGVMNYLFGIGLALWAFAAWVALRERPRRWRLAASTILVTVLFFCHLFALGLYATELLAFESYRLWSAREASLRHRLIDFVATGVPFLPALVLLLAGPTWDTAGIAPYWDMQGKIEGLLLAVRIYEPMVAFGLIAVLILAAVLAWQRSLLQIHPAGWWLLAFGGAIYLALPRVIFGAHMADQRLPIALLFMLAACIQVDLEARRARRGLVVVLGLMLGLRLTEVEVIWNDLSIGQSEALRSVKFIKRGARVLVAYGDRSATGLISDLGLVHIASLATIERSALVSTAFTVEGKHILQVHKEFRRYVDGRDGVPPSIPRFLAAEGPGPYYFSDWPHHYDDVYLLFTLPGGPNPDPAHLSLVNAGEHFQLYRVRPSS
jgi:hypothetical protein